jgi:DNA-binding beta-propeller fold protein YncE
MFCKMKIIVLFLVVFIAFGCKKKTVEPENPISDVKNGFLVLNEGLFNQNNASLSWSDSEKNNLSSDVFQSINQRGLGDTGNDMIRYGNKIYVVVNVSSTVEVLDANSFKSLKQIAMVENNKPKQPRNILGYGKFVYISCFDGFVDIFDTIDFQLLKRIKVGLNSENVCVLGNKLIVANSGGLNPPLMDSTLSVIDLTSQTEIKRITVGMNPGKIIPGLNQHIYVTIRGNYNDVDPTWKLIDIQNIDKEIDFKESISSFELFQDSLLLINKDDKALRLFSMKTNKYINSNFISLSTFTNPYQITYLPKSNEIAITDANGYVNQGFVSIFDENGIVKLKFKAGIIPSKIIRYE